MHSIPPLAFKSLASLTMRGSKLTESYKIFFCQIFFSQKGPRVKKFLEFLSLKLWRKSLVVLVPDNGRSLDKTRSALNKAAFQIHLWP